MSKTAEFYYDIEQMYIDGVSAKRIAELLECPIQIVYDVLEDMGVADSPQSEFDPYNTVNS
jgi:hypothetical protein